MFNARKKPYNICEQLISTSASQGWAVKSISDCQTVINTVLVNTVEVVNTVQYWSTDLFSDKVLLNKIFSGW